MAGRGDRVTKYRTIVADPPWAYTSSPTGSTTSAEGHYPTMRTEVMAQIDVASLSDDDAHLYVWVTNPILTEQRMGIVGDLNAPALVRAWGFEPKTILTWHKTGPPGMGFYWRGQTEHVIFGIRGNAPIPPARRLRNLFESPRRGHSEKPEMFLDLVEQVSPRPFLEMFSRRARFGWDTWGNESLGHVEIPGAA